MKLIRWLAAGLALSLAACQPTAPKTITILDSGKSYAVAAAPSSPSELFVRAGLILGPNDIALFNGMPARLDEALPDPLRGSLQLRRAVTITLQTPDGTRTIQSTAWTVGEALQEAGLALNASDRVEPPADTPLTTPITVSYAPASRITIHLKDGSLEVRSAAASVGEALAEAGIPVVGLDYSQPAVDQPLPADGQVRVVHVSEALVLAQKPIAFENEFQASAEVPIDQQQVLNPGQTGLSVSRVRIRYEDGQEIARQTESETLVRPPQNRVVGYGTKVEVKTASVDGAQIQYWRAVQMFATAYSPCRSAPGQCYSSTASGKPVRKGVVALRTDLYMAMRGQPLYIPGYGYASVEDACGGCVGKPWIDLGYSDDDYQQWGSWVTVYFLAPAPANPIYVLN
jgi:uncharacterized protein YabE (DUF348 family)